MVLSLFVLSPLTLASADTHSNTNFWSNGSVGAFLSADGMVRVMGATVTAVSGNVINATASFGGSVLNWIINVSADTKIFADGSRSASTTALTVGEKIAFSGSATATSGPAIIVSAKKVVDSSWKDFRKIAGIVAAVNSANGTYIVETKKDTNVTVQTNANTEWKVGPSTSLGASTTTGAFNSVAVGSWISALGTLSADGSVLTASSIAVRLEQIPQQLRDLKERWENVKDEWKDARKEWKEDHKDKDDGDRDLHLGTHLKGFLGVGFGH